MNKKLAGSIAFFSFIFILSLKPIADTDLGWHLQAGRFILQHHQVPSNDLFSYSLPNYPYVYHSWAGEALLALSYNLLGLNGTSILYAAISTVSALFLIKSSQIISHNRINQFGLLATIPIIYSVSGGRLRSYNLLFLAIILFLFLKFQFHKSKLILTVPLVFLLWANFHGSFPVGLFAFAVLSILLIASPQAQKDRLSKIKTLSFVLLTSTFATLVNPYHYHTWFQSFNMLGNSYTQVSRFNSDWQGILSASPSSLYVATFAFIIIILSSTLKTGLSQIYKIPLILFFTLSLISSRFIISTFVFLIPALNEILVSLTPKINIEVKRSFTYIFPVSILFLILILVGLHNLAQTKLANSSLDEYANYLATSAPIKNAFPSWPYKTNLFMEKNYPEKRFLNEANWGGYMLLLNGNRKLFYYPAMDNFIFNNQSFAFEYLALVNTTNDWESKMEKYKINGVFLPKNYPITEALKINKNWQTVYEDQLNTIIIKKN